jgi:hypothetical protein
MAVSRAMPSAARNGQALAEMVFPGVGDVAEIARGGPAHEAEFFIETVSARELGVGPQDHLAIAAGLREFERAGEERLRESRTAEGRIGIDLEDLDGVLLRHRQHAERSGDAAIGCVRDPEPAALAEEVAGRRAQLGKFRPLEEAMRIFGEACGDEFRQQFGIGIAGVAERGQGRGHAARLRSISGREQSRRSTPRMLATQRLAPDAPSNLHFICGQGR